MTPATIETYEAPTGGWSDAEPISDPTTEIPASGANTMVLHLAQMTRTAPRMIFKFKTGSGATGTSYAVRSMWGDTADYYPTTLTRSSAGLYLLTFPSTFEDELGNDEDVSFFSGKGCVESTSEYGHVQVVPAGYIVNVRITDMAGTPSDFTAGTTIIVVELS